jgi:hypothetical protein
MARPTKYSRDRARRVIEALGVGATYELASKYAGISPDTLDRWRKANAGFAEEMAEAEGRAATGWLAVIEQAARNGDWRAAAFKLERRYPASYGKTVQEQQLVGKDGGEAVVFVYKELAPDE